MIWFTIFFTVEIAASVLFLQQGGNEMKKIFWIIIAVVIMLASSFFGMDLMNVQAEEPSKSSYQKYYTSIEIQSGDSLWIIAERYKANSGKSTEELVEELKRMNALGGDIIHAGHYLTVPYYAE